MCGRYVSVKSDEDLTSEFDVEEVVGEPLPPSWNVAPTNDVRIIAKRKPHGHSEDPDAKPLIQMRTARWGLIPSWARPPASPENDPFYGTPTAVPRPKWRRGRWRPVSPAGDDSRWGASCGTPLRAGYLNRCRSLRREDERCRRVQPRRLLVA